jgi:hypothetical protein
VKFTKDRLSALTTACLIRLLEIGCLERLTVLLSPSTEARTMSLKLNARTYSSPAEEIISCSSQSLDEDDDKEREDGDVVASEFCNVLK